MKQKRRFSFRNYSVYYYLAILLFLIFLFFTNDFGIVDIQKTAIVMGVGIDPCEKGYAVTAQLAVPKHSDMGKQTESVEITGEGKTVAEAITEINAKTGWYPKLIFCDLILISEDIIDRDVFCFMDYFLRNENMNDNVQLAVCRGSAKEFLASKTPTDDMSTVAARKVLSEESQRAGQTVPMTLREFAAAYYSDASSSYMPYIERIEEAQVPPSDDAGGQGGSSAGGQEKPEREYVFNASQTVLFVRGKEVARLNAEQTLALGLFQNKIRLITLTVNKDGIVYSLGLRYADHKEKTRADDRPAFDLSFHATAQTLDSDVANSVSEIADTFRTKAELMQAAEYKLSRLISEVVTLSREQDCDLFGIQDRFEKFHPKYTKDHPDLLHEANVNILVRLKTLK